MKELTHQYKEIEVRTVIIDSDIYFRLSDVGNVLELTNPYRYDFVKKGSRTVTTLTNGGNQNIVYISEPTMYRLIFKSRKSEAVKFQDWIFEEVIPDLRKNGEYNISIDPAIRKKSIDTRKCLTKQWKDHGINKPIEYGTLTNETYKELGFEKGTKKSVMNKEQILKLMAFEALEMLNLHYNDANGLIECKESLHYTGGIIKNITDK